MQTCISNISDYDQGQMRDKRGIRAVLTNDQVLNIYMLKPSILPSPANQNRVGAAGVARIFGVSSKTIRDIWIGRTWYRATQQLDPARSDASERLQRRPGRPKGAKDRKPRSRKLHSSSTIDLQRASWYASCINNDGSLDRFRNAQAGSSYPETGIDLMWSAALEGPADPTSFLDRLDENPDLVDPFHDDWAFWPANNKPNDLQ